MNNITNVFFMLTLQFEETEVNSEFGFEVSKI